MDFSVEDLEKSFVAANSNPQFVGELIATFTRKLMSASVQMSPAGSITEATAAFIEIFHYLNGFDGPKLRDAMNAAEECLRVDHRRDPEVEAAQAGVQFLLAKSSSDGYSAARASKASSTFREAMHHALNGQD